MGNKPPLPAARRTEFPGFIEPCHPTLVPRAPAGARWLHEIKVDGYRCQLHIHNGTVKAFTRRGYDWSPRFRSVVEAAQTLPVTAAILDGEVIVPGEGNLSDFAALQAEVAGGRSERLVFYAFDLLQDGFDLRPVALTKRKRRLQQLIQAANSSRFVFAEEFEGDGESLHARVCTAGLEGLVSKLRDSRYQSGRNDTWLKVTCRKRDTFVVCGFIPAPGKSLAAIYVARRIEGKLIYAGKAAAGLTGDAARDLRQHLDRLVRRTSPLDRPVKKPKAVWVEPEIQVDLEYRGISGDGRLRHASYKGLREDLTRPVPRGRTTEAAKRLKYNIQRLLPEAVVPGKEELRQYWRKVGTAALRYIGGRPLTLVRHIDGITFFHTRRLPKMPAAVHSMQFEKREGGEGVRAYVDSVQGLVALVDMDVVEVHPWNAKVHDIEHPDQMIFDLDPHESVPWDFVAETALGMRAMLKQEGFDPWPKGTGGKGLHVMAPIRPARTHDEVAALAKRLASQFAKSDSRYTTSNAVARRAGKEDLH